MPDLRRNLDAHRRWLERSFTSLEVRDLPQIFEPEVEFHHHGGIDFGPGLEGVRKMLHTYRTAAGDLRLSVKSQHPSGPVVTSCFLASGTHTGKIFGITPTGNRIWVEGVEVATFSPAGKIARSLFYLDAFSFLRQVGVPALARIREIVREGQRGADPLAPPPEDD